MRRPAAGRSFAAGGALAAALTLAACGAGAPAHDLFLVQRGGAIPGAKLALRVTDDGRASCNRGPLVEITSAQLIDARELQRDLEPLAKRRLALPPGRDSILEYRVVLEDGVVYAEPGEGRDALRAAGRDIVAFRSRNLFFGGVQAVERDPATGALAGAGDPRRGGVAVAA